MREIYTLIPKIMQEINPIGKDSTNVMQNYKFRGIDTVYNEVHDILAKYGVFTVPKAVSVERSTHTTAKGSILFYSIVTMEYTFFAPDGSSVVASVIGEGMDSGDKATNKAMAVAHKYALLQTFCIPTDDAKDPENDNHEIKAPTTTQTSKAPAKTDACAICGTVGKYHKPGCPNSPK
jgi:hypothetical protein